MQTQEWLQDIKRSMQPRRRTVVNSRILYCQDSASCTDAVREFQLLTGSVGQRLHDALRPVPLSAGQVLSDEQSESETNAWRLLAEHSEVTVPKRTGSANEPALTLIMPFTSIATEESRLELLNQLGNKRDAFSSIVCLFLVETGRPESAGAWDLAAWQTWIAEIRNRLPQSVVRYYVVGDTTSTGTLVSRREVAAVVAHAVFADLVLSDRASPRFLAVSLAEPAASVGMLGATGRMASSDAIAHSLAPEVFSDLLDEIQVGSKDLRELSPDLPATSARLLAQSFQHAMPFDAKGVLERGESADRHDYEIPSLVGFHERFTVDIAKATKTMDLDRIPSRLWRNRLTELDTVVSEQRATAIAERASEYLKSRADAEWNQCRQVLQAAFRGQLRDGGLSEVSSRLLDRIEQRREAVVVQGETDSVASCLDRMDLHLEQSEQWTLGLLIMLLTLGVSAAITAAVARWGNGIALLVCGILGISSVIFAGGRTLFRWYGACQRAQDARDDTLEQIQRRAQGIICQRMFDELAQHTARLSENIREAAAILTRASSYLHRPKDGLSTAARDSFNLLERPTPDMERYDIIYQRVVHQGRRYDTLQTKFRERMHDLANDLLEHTVKAEDVQSCLLDFVKDQLRFILSHQMDVWRFFTSDGNANSFDEAEFDAHVESWSQPVLCGEVPTGLDRSLFATETLWISPEAVSSRLAHVGRRTLVVMEDRIVAMHRLTYGSRGIAFVRY